MYRLTCPCMNYDWGKSGKTSAVAQLKSKAGDGAIDADKPYAEFWFGTHPSGPSEINVEGKSEALHTWLQANPSALGIPLYGASSVLPYLFKVLSVAKALSVQAHPDRTLAAQLHVNAPQHYKDDNHKPEMTCALTPFEAMCSFRAPGDLVAHVHCVPELVELMGEARCKAMQAAATELGTDREGTGRGEFTAALKDAYAAYMSAPEAAVKAAVLSLQSRLSASGVDPNGALIADEAGQHKPASADSVALRLCGQYPGDGGVFAPYWLNVLCLSPGQAVFLPANEPHAYLSGDCMEVMAASDNVVRAGLTPKFKDVDILVGMLTYSAGAPPVLEGEPAPFDPQFTRVYHAPVPEFVLYKTCVPRAAEGKGQVAALHAPPSAAIMVMIQGSGRVDLADGRTIPIKEGQIWLQAAGQALTLTSSGQDELLMFRTHANVDGST